MQTLWADDLGCRVEGLENAMEWEDDPWLEPSSDNQPVEGTVDPVSDAAWANFAITNIIIRKQEVAMLTALG